MKGVLPAALLTALALAGCHKDDGVPKVDIHGTIVVTGNANEWTGVIPKVRTIHLPDGKQMPLSEFLLTYCVGKVTNETCLRGEKIQRIDFTKGPGDLPAGL